MFIDKNMWTSIADANRSWPFYYDISFEHFNQGKWML